MYYLSRETFLVKNKESITNWLNVGFSLHVWVKFMGWKLTDSSLKEKFRVHWPVKKVMLKVFWGMKWPTTIDFLEKGQIVICIPYCQVFR